MTVVIWREQALLHRATAVPALWLDMNINMIVLPDVNIFYDKLIISIFRSIQH